MTTFIIVFAAAIIFAAVASFIAVLLRVLPWDTNKAVKEMITATEVQGESKYIDREEAVYQVVRSRQTLAGMLLGFAALLVVCATVIIVALMKSAEGAAKPSSGVTVKGDGSDEGKAGSRADSAMPKASVSQLPQDKAPTLPANPVSAQRGALPETKTESGVPPK